MKRPAQIAAAVFALAPLAATPYFWLTAESPRERQAPIDFAKETELRDQIANLQDKGLLNDEEAAQARRSIAELKNLCSGHGAPEVDFHVERFGDGWRVVKAAEPRL